VKTADWILVCSNAALSTLLLRASAEKFVNPAVSAAALRELVRRARPGPTGLVRLAAALEALVALAIAIPVLRLPDQVLVGALGCAFLVLGAVGKVRGSSQPCGCLGAGSARPFGTTNMLMGAALLAVTLVNLEGPQIGDADTVAAGTALLAVIMSVGWLLWTDRRHIRVVIGNVRKGTESI
jgi:hypothetical protein